MPVSHGLRCLFVHVPRTGGTSIESALGMGGSDDAENEGLLFGRIRSEKYRALGFGSDFFQHLTLREIRKLESSAKIRDYFSFAVVRNPWDRIVSVYSRMKAGNASVLAEQLGVVDPGSLSFAAFLEAAEGSTHPHIIPQIDFLTDESGEIAVDKVGRFENLQTAFDEVRWRLNKADLYLPHVNQSSHAHYSSYYDDETRERVARMYARDIEAFGYTFETTHPSEGNGYVYASLGEKYIQEARDSAISLRKVDPSAKITLLTDEDVPAREFDQVVVRPVNPINILRKEGAKRDWNDKALLAFAFRAEHMYEASPYERTFYIDSDTHFLESCTPVFEMLKHFDFCMAPAPMDDITPVVGNTRLTGCTPLNCGVIGFRRGDVVKKVLSDWHLAYKGKLEQGMLVEGRFEGDQASFIEAWLRSQAKIYTLPPIWNFRIPFPATLNGPVRLVHGRHNDFEHLRRRLNSAITIRTWDPQSERCRVHGEGLLARIRQRLRG